MSMLEQQLSEHEIRPNQLRDAQREAIARDLARLQSRRGEFVHVACPACDQDSFDATFRKTTFEFVTCRHCGTLYMNPRPSESVMAWHYSGSESYRYWAQHMFPASEEARREKIHRPRLERLVGYCDRFDVPRRTLMEVGAGFGTFSALAQETGSFSRVIAVEPTPELAEACRSRGIVTIEQRIEDIDDQCGDVDVAVAFEVIEHLFAPRTFLSRLGSVLRPGGLLVVSCPNGQGFDIEVLGAASHSVDAGHVNLFNPTSLHGLVEDCGFAVLDLATPGRLDVELVRKAAMEGRIDLADRPFVKRVVLDEWDRLGWPFQQFLAAHGLSSHMWLVAQKSG